MGKFYALATILIFWAGDDSDDDNVVDDVVADEDDAYHCYESSPSSVAQGMAKMLCAPLAIFSRQRRRPNEPTEAPTVESIEEQ